jgi:SAM-dependent methyltransferase
LRTQAQVVADFIWGEDAWCYVTDKPKLIAEAERLVRGGGVIAFADWVEGPTGLSMGEAQRFLSRGSLQRWGPRQAHHSRRPQAANREPSLRCCGIDSAAPSNRRVRAQPNSSPVLSPLGSTVLDFVLALVAAMARQPDHRPFRDSLALAP